MAIRSVMFEGAWWDSENGAFVEAIVFLESEDPQSYVVIEPRIDGENNGMRLERWEWEGLRDFIDEEFRRLDRIEHDKDVADGKIRE